MPLDQRQVYRDFQYVSISMPHQDIYPFMIFKVRVTPGEHNLGIFINLKNRGDESYRLTHPAASLGGLLRGISLAWLDDFVWFYSHTQATRIP